VENTGEVFAPSLTAAAERVLTQAFGAPVTLGKAEVLREQYRNRVIRCPVVEGPPDLPASVIVKAVVKENEQASEAEIVKEAVGEDEHASEAEMDSEAKQGAEAEQDSLGSTIWRLYNEWAGNLFLNARSTDPRLNARLLGGDGESGLFVLEDLGDGLSLADVVQGSDPEAAETAFLHYARALGRMHAATVGHADTWRQTRIAIGGTEQEREREGVRWLRENVDPFRQLCAELDVPLASGFEDDVEAVRQMCDDPGPFDAFSPNDTCPDNHRLMPDGSLRFFDFEWAGFHHALLDAAYLRLPFPTCWCVNRLPADLPTRLEDAYRTELARNCASALDDSLFYACMSQACAYWTLATLSWNWKASIPPAAGLHPE
jgi:hypothetical protein